jgi:hypothetical protein
VSWIELAERSVLGDMQLQLEYQQVKNRTSNNGTYIDVRPATATGACMAMHVARPDTSNDLVLPVLRNSEAPAVQLVKSKNNLLQGSHVQEFGQRSIAEEVAGDFQGSWRQVISALPDSKQQPTDLGFHSASRPQHEADLVHLEQVVFAASDPAHVARAQRALDAELSARSTVDSRMRRAVDSLLRQYPQQLGRKLKGTPEDSYLGVQHTTSAHTSNFVTYLGKPCLFSWICHVAYTLDEESAIRKALTLRVHVACGAHVACAPGQLCSLMP